MILILKENSERRTLRKRNRNERPIKKEMSRMIAENTDLLRMADPWRTLVEGDEASYLPKW